MSTDVKRWQRARIITPGQDTTGQELWIRFQTNVTSDSGSPLCLLADQIELLPEFAAEVEIITLKKFYELPKPAEVI